MRALPVATTLVLSGCVTESREGEADALKTPDGLTPSVEDVCDDYSGAAYGLCTAYCEAMDCDDPNVHASNNACEHVADNFTKKTGDPLPCESEPVTCSIDANDDTFEFPIGNFNFNVFDNDDIVGAAGLDEVPPVVDNVVNLSILDFVAGTIAGESIVEGEYEFMYTACCDGGPCDSATVYLTLTGS